MLRRSVLFVFVMVFVIGFASAELAVLGTIYEEGSAPGTLSGGATVSVTCDSTTLTNTTGVDGIYAFSFNSTSECPDGAVMTISYSKSGFDTFNGNKVIDYSTITNLGSLFLIISDHFLVATSAGGGPSSSSGGGSSSSSGGNVCISEFWECGDWRICSEDLKQERECISNCRSIKTESRFCEDVVSDDTIFTEIGDSADDAPAGGFLSGITGAVVGTLGAGGRVVAAVFVALVVAGFVFTRMKEKEIEDSNSK